MVPPFHERTAGGRKAGPLPRAEASPRDEARSLFRNAILEAAEAVFAARGFHGARIQDVAARARIAVGTVYNHFGCKERVLDQLLEERADAALAALEPQPGDPAEFRDRLTARIRRMLAFIELHRGFYAIMMSEVKKPPGRVQRFRTAFRAIIEEGLAAGAIRSTADPADLAIVLSGILRAVLLEMLEKGAPRAERAPLVVDLFLRGAGADAAPAKRRK